MRSYDVATVAVALACPTKWVDNVLSRHELPGVVRERQGISRRVTIDGLVHLALVHALTADLGLQVERAVRLAKSLCVAGGEAAAGDRCSVRVNLVRLRDDLAVGLREAVETVQRPRRGRPPLRR